MGIKRTLLSVAVALLLLAAGSPPAFCWFDSSNFDISTTVNVSTSMQTGATTLLSGISNGGSVVLYSKATPGVTGEYIAIDDNVSVSTSTTGSFQIPTGTVFTLGDYTGPLYALVVGTTPVKVSVLRKR